jgi:glycosyltransferase involved in cell wall biosynthesis
MRALVVTNMEPSSADPGRGVFVRDQVAALRAIEGLDVEVHSFPPGMAEYPRAARALRRRFGARRFDVVHAHFGLTAWPALAARASARLVTLHGTDLRHPRSALLSRAALRAGVVPAAVSASLARLLPGAGRRRRALVLPCGIDLERFRPLPREQARSRLGLDAGRRYLLFPAAPSRAAKRHDLAQSLADAAGAELLALGGVPPDEVPWWINAADAVVVPSEAEGFGLAVLEALACDVPVLATPVGIHPLALRGIAGTHCGPFALDTWGAALAPHLAAADPRVAGRARAALFGSHRMASRVAVAWGALLDEGRGAPQGAQEPPLYSRAEAPAPGRGATPA